MKLQLEGVQSAVYVYVNGRFVGYASDSFSGTEFDVSEYVLDRDGLIAREATRAKTKGES